MKTSFRIFAALALCLIVAACDSDEERAEAAYQRGIALLESGDVDRARIEFRNAVRTDITHVPAHMELGRIHIGQGNFRPAFRSFRFAVENEPNNKEALIALSQIGFLSNDWESFVRYSDRLSTLAPDDPEVQVIQIAANYRQASLDKDDAAKAKFILEAKAQQETLPDDRILRRMLIDGFLQNEQFEEALAQIDLAIGDDPRNIDIYKLKVQLLARLGNVAETESTLRDMVDAFPKDEETRSAYLRFLIGRGQTDTAEAFLRERAEQATTPADTDTAYITLMQFLSAQRGDQVALDELETVIAARPESHRLKALRAVMNFEMGNQDQALEQMETLVSTETVTETFTLEDQLAYKTSLAQMLRATQNEVGARRMVEEVLKDDPNNVEALKMQAAWFIDEDKTSAAITALRTAMAEDPRNAEAMSLMAWAYERAGDTTLMMDFLSLAVEASNNAPEESLRFTNALLAEGREDQAKNILLNAVRLQPRNLALLINLGQLYLRTQDFSRAEQVQRSMEDIGTEAALNAAKNVQLGLIATQDGTQRAMEFLEELATSSEGTDSNKLSLVRGLLQTGELERADKLVSEMSAADPDNLRIVFFKALTQASLRNFEEAARITRSVVDKSPQTTQAWMLLSRLQNNMTSRAEAVATIDEALSHQPKSAQLMWMKASYLEQDGDFDGAIALYEQIYENNSDSIVAANNLASLISTHKTDEASLERARVIAQRLKTSNIPAFKDTYGWILHRSGKSEEALPYLEDAAKGLPENTFVQIHLGHTYLSLGRVDDAKTQLNRARVLAGPVQDNAVKAKIEALETEIAGQATAE